MKLELYLANKMSGKPYFNAPWFFEAAEFLRTLYTVSEVFNPAEQDIKRGFDPMKCPTGSPQEAEKAGFVLRDALGDDYAWITKHSDGLVIGPEWRTSPGTISEIAVHQALGLPVWEFHVIRGRVFSSRDSLWENPLPPLLELGKLGYLETI